MGRRERSGEPGRLKIAAPRGGFGAGGKSAATARATHGWGRTGGDHVLSLRHGERLSVPTIGRALDSAVRCGVPARSEGRLCAERPESRDPETGYLCKLDWRNLLEMIRCSLPHVSSQSPTPRLAHCVPRGWEGHPSHSACRCPNSSAAMATRTFSTSKSYGKPRSRVRGLTILGAIVTFVLFAALSLTTGWPMGPRTKRRMGEAMHNAYQWEEAHFHIGSSLQRPHALSKRPLRPDERDQVRARSAPDSDADDAHHHRTRPKCPQTECSSLSHSRMSDLFLFLSRERPVPRSSPSAARVWCSFPATTTRGATARTTG